MGSSSEQDRSPAGQRDNRQTDTNTQRWESGECCTGSQDRRSVGSGRAGAPRSEGGKAHLGPATASAKGRGRSRREERGRAGEKGRGEAGRLRLEAQEGPAGFQERVPTGGRGRAVGCSLSVPGLCCMDQVGGSRNSLEPPPWGQMSQEAAETSAGVGSHVHSALLSGPWPTPWHQPRQPRCPAKKIGRAHV